MDIVLFIFSDQLHCSANRALAVLVTITWQELSIITSIFYSEPTQESKLFRLDFDIIR
jgi:hypothetical protein